MLPYLLAGAVFLSLFAKPRRKTIPIQNKNNSGLDFRCNSIKLIDKTKFHDYLKLKIKQNNPNIVLYKINYDLIPIFLKLFEQINKTCFDKFIKQKLTSIEKTTILILFSEISDAMRELIIQDYLDKGYTDTDFINNIYDQKLNLFSDYLSMWMNARKELQVLPAILDKFATTYVYP